MLLNNFQLLQSVWQVSRRTSKKYELIQDKLGGLFKELQWSECLKLNQSGQDMSLSVVIQGGGNPG